MRTYLLLACIFVIAGLGLALADKGTLSPAADSPVSMPGAVHAKATFAGGCFWCMEGPFEKLDGVVSAVSGYSGGTTENPIYENYSQGGHIEVVEIVYDPAEVSYQKLLDVYWRQVDPTDPGGQFVDRGHGYTTAIFYHDEEQQRLAEASKQALEARKIYGKPIVTPILPEIGRAHV